MAAPSAAAAVWSYKPPLAQCLEKLSTQVPLQRGLGRLLGPGLLIRHAQSTVASSSSSASIRPAAARRLNDIDGFTANQSAMSTFVNSEPHQLARSAVQTRFGPPDRVERCGGDTVWLYLGENNMRIALPLRVGRG